MKLADKSVNQISLGDFVIRKRKGHDGDMFK